jgi:hypothetical protein
VKRAWRIKNVLVLRQSTILSSYIKMSEYEQAKHGDKSGISQLLHGRLAT